MGNDPAELFALQKLAAPHTLWYAFRSMKRYLAISLFLLVLTTKVQAQPDTPLHDRIDQEIAALQKRILDHGRDSPQAKWLQRKLTIQSGLRRTSEIAFTYFIIAPLAVGASWIASSTGTKSLMESGILPVNGAQLQFAFPILISTGAGMISREISTRLWDHLGGLKYKIIDAEISTLLREYATRARAAVEDAERALAYQDAKLLDYSLTRLSELADTVQAAAAKVRNQLLEDRSWLGNRWRRRFVRLRMTQVSHEGLVDILKLQLQLLEKLKTADQGLINEVVHRMTARSSRSGNKCFEAMTNLVQLSHPPKFRR